MTHTCHKCKRATELILKMGGLICGSCRAICFYPHDKDGVYDAEYKKAKEQMQKELDRYSEFDRLSEEE